MEKTKSKENTWSKNNALRQEEVLNTTELSIIQMADCFFLRLEKHNIARQLPVFLTTKA